MTSRAPIALCVALAASAASAGPSDDNDAITAYSGGRFVLRQAESGECVPANAERIIDMMANTSCKSIEWISGERAIDLGLATKLEAPGIDVFGPEASRRPKP